MSIKIKTERIFRRVAEHEVGDIVSFRERFHPNPDDIAIARDLNAAFLRLLSGTDVPGYEQALQYLESMTMPHWSAAAGFLRRGIDLIFREIEECCKKDERFLRSLNDLYERLTAGGRPRDNDEITAMIWKVFFPEGNIEGTMDDAIVALRKKRRIDIIRLNEHPVTAPEREVLFTANALLTVPADGGGSAGLGAGLKKTLADIAAERQRYWYDHPIPVGTAPEQNEVLYGLSGLCRAARYEESIGRKDPSKNIACVLSVSVTHPGLHKIARSWIQSELESAGGLQGMDLYIFTEDDARRLVQEVIAPAAARLSPNRDVSPLEEVFGVDGEYGRHYSFLKAIARFWSVFVSPEIKATFKIDLDQVFPQEELVRETGMSAFGHLCSPLWGAHGTDSAGDEVYLGMFAGALVNRRDIGTSLFTPDVLFPETPPEGDEVVFRSAAPQALSTVTEMMTRYVPGGDPDGTASALQRVHVTGGTNGILVEALKRYRPFTPACIGRAEDQAYLLSVLYRPESGGFLRYAHAAGLIMRHDSDMFPDAAKAAWTGMKLGDYARIMNFSDYAAALPWGFERVKDAVDPFTGCFISRIPITIVFLRFALKASRLFESDNPEEGLRFFTDGVKRLPGMIAEHAAGRNPMKDTYEREKRGWDLYYDILDAVEHKLAEGDVWAGGLARTAREIVESVRVRSE